MLIPPGPTHEIVTMKRFPLFVGTGLLVACSGITDTACACSPFEGPLVLITGTVRSPALAPVPGAAVQVRPMNPVTCEAVEPTLVRVVQTDAAGRFRHGENESNRSMCYRVWAEPPQGSALARSDSQFVRVQFTDTLATPDRVDLAFQLR
jgi:hypothetical protein